MISYRRDGTGLRGLVAYIAASARVGHYLRPHRATANDQLAECSDTLDGRYRGGLVDRAHYTPHTRARGGIKDRNHEDADNLRHQTSLSSSDSHCVCHAIPAYYVHTTCARTPHKRAAVCSCVFHNFGARLREEFSERDGISRKCQQQRTSTADRDDAEIASPRGGPWTVIRRRRCNGLWKRSDATGRPPRDIARTRRASRTVFTGVPSWWRGLMQCFRRAANHASPSAIVSCTLRGLTSRIHRRPRTTSGRPPIFPAGHGGRANRTPVITTLRSCRVHSARVISNNTYVRRNHSIIINVLAHGNNRYTIIITS